MASELIYREDAKDFVYHAYHKGLNPVKYLDEVPVADVVARDCYDRILAENDTMRKQLAQIGKKASDKMEDVRSVVRGRWYWDNYKYDWCCSNCLHPADHNIEKEDAYKEPTFKFCPHCGAVMLEPQTLKNASQNADDEVMMPAT